METLKLNNTPVRTSRNFGINNIELKDIELPENLKEFKNVEIINEGCSLEKSISNKKLVYGNGKILEENILKNANSSLKIISNSKNSNIKIKYNPFFITYTPFFLNRYTIYPIPNIIKPMTLATTKGSILAASAVKFFSSITFSTR